LTGPQIFFPGGGACDGDRRARHPAGAPRRRVRATLVQIGRSEPEGWVVEFDSTRAIRKPGRPEKPVVLADVATCHAVTLWRPIGVATSSGGPRAVLLAASRTDGGVAADRLVRRSPPLRVYRGRSRRSCLGVARVALDETNIGSRGAGADRRIGAPDEGPVKWPGGAGERERGVGATFRRWSRGGGTERSGPTRPARMGHTGGTAGALGDPRTLTGRRWPGGGWPGTGSRSEACERPQATTTTTIEDGYA